MAKYGGGGKFLAHNLSFNFVKKCFKNVQEIMLNWN